MGPYLCRDPGAARALGEEEQLVFGPEVDVEKRDVQVLDGRLG